MKLVNFEVDADVHVGMIVKIAGIGVIENRIIGEPTVPALREPSRWRRGDEGQSAAR
jgi:hypothetical protein